MLKKKTHLLLMIFTTLFIMSVFPVEALIFNVNEKVSDTIEYSSDDYNVHLYRKFYPYTSKASLISKYDTLKPSICYAAGPTVNPSLSSISLPSMLSGPMDSPWPMKSYNTQRIGRSPYSAADNPGIEKWRFWDGYNGGVDSGMVIDNDGNIYFGAKNGYLYSLYPNGTLRWKYQTNGQIFSTPALADDRTLYITSTDNFLYAILPNGTLKWRFNSLMIISSSPVIAPNGTVYIGNSGGVVFAVAPNGSELWRFKLDGDIYGDPALGPDGTIYIGSWDNNMYALYPNGMLKWRFPTGNHVKGVPSIGPDGTIYFGSWDGYLYALHPDGSMRWRCNVGSGSETTPAIAEDGTIYVGGDELYAVNPDGTMKWVFILSGPHMHIFQSCPCISADGTIYVGVDVGDGYGGYIIAVNPDGTERWSKPIAKDWVDSSPAIAKDGTVYIGSTYDVAKGYLHAFGKIESNSPPGITIISGPTQGKTGVSYRYYFVAVDPDNNPIELFVDWGDGSSGWIDTIASGETKSAEHTWSVEGSYTIKAKVKDVMGEEGPENMFNLTIKPNSRALFDFNLLSFLERFPILEKIMYLINI